MHFRHRDQRILGCANLADIFVPYLDDALFWNQIGRVGDSGELRMGNSAAHRAGDKGSQFGLDRAAMAKQLFFDAIHKFPGVGFGVNVLSHLVQAQGSLPVNLEACFGLFDFLLLLRSELGLLRLSEWQQRGE